MSDIDELERLWLDDRNRPGGTIAQAHVLALIDRVKRAEAAIAEALRLDDANQPRNLINHVLAAYQNGDSND